MSFIASYFFLSLFFNSTAPWHNLSERKTPWGAVTPGSETSTKKVGFFQSFLGGSYADEEHGDEEELRQLPWDEYERKYAGEPERELVWPVEQGRISSGFGQRRGRMHEGLDIAAVSGRPVRAAASGRVVFAGFVRGYGNTVVVYHGQGMATVYGHNRENLTAVGQIVQRGQTIATVGTTGRATGSHVHFEVRKNGVAVNPLRYSFERPWEVGQVSSR